MKGLNIKKSKINYINQLIAKFNAENYRDLILEFDAYEYKTIYDDLFNLSDQEALIHYVELGLGEDRYNSFKSFLSRLEIKEIKNCFKNNINSKGKQELLKFASEKLDLNVFEYKTIYDDLSMLEDIKAIQHYMVLGIEEGRHNSFKSFLSRLEIKEIKNCFKNNINSKGKQELLKFASEKLDLNVFEYKSIYLDLFHLSDQEALIHYIEKGIGERRYRSFDQIKKKLKPAINLELYTKILDSISQFKRKNLSENKFENIYYHLVDEKTQDFAEKNWTKFKFNALSDLIFCLITDNQISPIPIKILLDALYDNVFLESINPNEEFPINKKLLSILINGRNFEKLQNQKNSIYLLILLTKVLSVEDQFIECLSKDFELFCEYYLSLISFVKDWRSLKVSKNLKYLLFQYIVLIEIYLMKNFSDQSKIVLDNDKYLKKVRKIAIYSSLSLKGKNILFIEHPTLSFDELIGGLKILLTNRC